MSYPNVFSNTQMQIAALMTQIERRAALYTPAGRKRWRFDQAFTLSMRKGNGQKIVAPVRYWQNSWYIVDGAESPGACSKALAARLIADAMNRNEE